MKVNHDKCYLLVSGKNCVIMNVNGFEIENTECDKLLRIKVDCEMKFKIYLHDVIKKTSNRVNTLSRVTLFMSLAKKRILMISF